MRVNKPTDCGSMALITQDDLDKLNTYNAELVEALENIRDMAYNGRSAHIMATDALNKYTTNTSCEAKENGDD